MVYRTYCKSRWIKSLISGCVCLVSLSPSNEHLVMFICFLCLSLSGPFRSWPVTRTPWWPSLYTTHSAPRPSATLSKKVHKKFTFKRTHTTCSALDRGHWYKLSGSTCAVCFPSWHLHGDLRCTWKGWDDHGLRQREWADGEDHRAHRAVWQRAGDAWTGLRHRGSEFKGVWGENTS